MDRAKVMEKIKKCMALGSSPNENEAAAAMRQAQKLMRVYSISEAEITTIGYSCEVIKTTIQCGKVVPLALHNLYITVSQAFGVRVLIRRVIRVSDKNWDVEYYGPQHRVMLAAYTHVVLQRALDKAWATFRRDYPNRASATGARAGFHIGWLQKVRGTVEAFAITDVEVNATAQLIENLNGAVKDIDSSKSKFDLQAAYHGMDAANGFMLHRPVTSTQKLIGE